MDRLLTRRHSKNEFLESVLDTLYHIGHIGSISPLYIDILANSEKKIEVSFTVKLDNGEVKLYRGGFVQHSTTLGPSIGSIEIIKNANIDDCEALAMLMTLQTAVLGIPLGGSKGIIYTDTKELNKDETERLYKAYMKAILDIVGKDRNIIKLYENSNEYVSYPIIDIVEKELKDINAVVNRPEEYFGTGLIKRSQAFSIAQCVKNILDTYSNKELPDINIGVTMDDETMDVDLLIELNNLGLKILGFATDEDKNIQLYREKIWQIIYNNNWERRHCIRVKKVNPYPQSDEESILTSNVDILVLQDARFRITADMAEKIKAKFIVEAESNMITTEAETILEDNGVIIIPDFISLGGVLVNSYIEWAYGHAANIVAGNTWKNIISKMLNKSLGEIFNIKDSVGGITTKEASLLYAIRRLADIIEKRGF